MTPLHHLIKGKLLPICLEVTAKVREQLEPKDKEKKRRADEILKGIKKAAKEHSVDPSSNTYNFVTKSLAAALDLPELIQNSKSYFPPMCVVRDIAGENPSLPILVTHGERLYYLDSDGYNAEFSSRAIPASDEEIESCLDNFSTFQLKTILKESLFEPYIVDLFEQTTELVTVIESQTTEDDDIPF